jgi:hypothetical protein
VGGVPAALRPGDAVLPGSHICGFHRVFGERKPRHPAQSCLCTQCVRKSRPLSCALRDRRGARKQTYGTCLLAPATACCGGGGWCACGRRPLLTRAGQRPGSGRGADRGGQAAVRE